MNMSAATGIELEPAYNKPFLSSSLTDFWGKRWNLLISNLMRTAVYEPVLYVCLRAVQDANSGKFPASRVEAKVLNESYKPSDALVTERFEFPGLLHSCTGQLLLLKPFLRRVSWAMIMLHIFANRSESPAANNQFKHIKATNITQKLKKTSSILCSILSQHR
jgi:hypothetical protein